MNNKIINIITLFFISFTNLLGLKAQLSEPLPFMTKFEPKSATIVNYSKLQKLNENSALVRLPNNKISLMVRNKGTLEPFYIKAIETGYWDTRYETDTNYDTVFADMRDMGANTAYVMIHWEEIETSDNHFDYSFADNIVAAASR